jgi:chromosome segregation ATPase
MINKKSNIQKLTDQLQQWDVEIDELKGEADKARASSRADLINQIDELRDKKETAQDQLKLLQTANNNAWDDMKAGVEKSWSELKNAVSKASIQFK